MRNDKDHLAWLNCDGRLILAGRTGFEELLLYFPFRVFLVGVSPNNDPTHEVIAGRFHINGTLSIGSGIENDLLGYNPSADLSAT